MRLIPYKMSSRSAKALASELGIKRARPDGNFRNNFRHKILNWGNSMPFQFPSSWGVLNHPDAVRLSACKLKSFRAFQEYGVPTPLWTTDKQEAEAFSFRGFTVFARHRLDGRSGQGIEMIRHGQTMPDAPLYTVLFKKVTEYRVHSTDTEVFDFQAKLKRKGQEADEYIHNYDNGRVFCRKGIELPQSATDASILAVTSLGLDFGAVDVGVDEEGNAAVFEVNSAPSLQGTTLKSYANMIRGLL